MPPLSLLDDVTRTTLGFLTGLTAEEVRRIEARAAGPDGMQLLCAVEAAVNETLTARPARELVWLTGGGDGHRLHLLAFGPGGVLMAETGHEFAPRAPADL